MKLTRVIFVNDILVGNKSRIDEHVDGGKLMVNLQFVSRFKVGLS